MKQLLMAVFDSKVGVFMAPMVFLTLGQALRSFEDGVMSDPSFKAHPEDYSLWHVGHWDPAKGPSELEGGPVQVELAATVKAVADTRQLSLLKREA